MERGKRSHRQRPEHHAPHVYIGEPKSHSLLSLYHLPIIIQTKQFTSVLILYALVLELTAQQYLWADMGVVLGLVVLVPTMGPKPFLQRGKAEGREESSMSACLFLCIRS